MVKRLRHRPLTAVTRVRFPVGLPSADMAELADAHGSGPCAGDSMQVQVLFPAPRASIYACPFSLALQPRGINKEPAAFKCGRPFLAA